MKEDRNVAKVGVGTAAGRKERATRGLGEGGKSV